MRGMTRWLCSALALSLVSIGLIWSGGVTAAQTPSTFSADSATCDGLVSASYAGVQSETDVTIGILLVGTLLSGQENSLTRETITIGAGSDTISHQLDVPEGEYSFAIATIESGAGSTYVSDESPRFYCAGPQADLTFVSISADCSGLVTFQFDPDTIHPGDAAYLGVYGGFAKIDGAGPIELVPGQSAYNYRLDSSTWPQFPDGVRVQVSWAPETQGNTEPFKCSSAAPIDQPAEAAAACQQGSHANWTRQDGSTFKNTGHCVKYVAGGGVLVPAAP